MQKYDDVMKDLLKDKAANYTAENDVSVEKLAKLQQNVLAALEQVILCKL